MQVSQGVAELRAGAFHEPKADPGPTGIGKARIEPVQAALVDVIAERGLEQAGVDEIARRAGLTEENFSRLYGSVEVGATAAFEALEQDFRGQLVAAFECHDEWSTSLRAAAYAAADWLVSNPNAMRFGCVEVLKMRSEPVRVKREELILFCAGLIDQGRQDAGDPEEIPESAALFVAGSIVQSVTYRLQRGDDLNPHREVPRMMFSAVLPYRGEVEARSELSMPRP